MRLSRVAALAAALAAQASVHLVLVGGADPDPRPNIVFLVCESTDGRTWTPGYSGGALDGALPAIRSLQARGSTFTRHYSNAPVCCPSRASFWSGRHAHKIKHLNVLVRATPLPPPSLSRALCLCLSLSLSLALSLSACEWGPRAEIPWRGRGCGRASPRAPMHPKRCNAARRCAATLWWQWRAWGS